MLRKGEIAITLTIVSIIFITIGILIGSYIVTTPTLRQYFTEAQEEPTSPSRVAELLTTPIPPTPTPTPFPGCLNSCTFGPQAPSPCQAGEQCDCDTGLICAHDGIREGNSGTCVLPDVPGCDLTNPTQAECCIVPPEPANIEVELNLSGEFMDNFETFDYIIETCNLPEGDGEVTNCSSNGNAGTGIVEVHKSDYEQAGGSYTKTHILNDIPGGDRALMLFYGHYRDDGQKDITGIYVDQDQSSCILTNEKVNDRIGGGAGCGIAVDGVTISHTFNVSLPDPDSKTYSLMLGNDNSQADPQRSLFDDCSFNTDTNGATYNGTLGNERCSAKFLNDTMKVTYAHPANEQSDVSVYWKLNRCNGRKEDQNLNICPDNNTGQGIDILNFFELKNSLSVSPGESLQCEMKPSNYPSSETESTVRQIITCTTITTTETPTPTLSSTSPTPTIRTLSPTPTPVRNVFYSSFAIYNSTQKAVTGLKVTTCVNNNCTTKPTISVDIRPSQSGYIEDEVDIGIGNTLYSLRCSLLFDDNTEQACPIVDTADGQNILFKMNLTENGISGTGFTESQACDVNEDQCCNGSDFGVVVSHYAEIQAEGSFVRHDINGDYITNAIDLVYTLANLGEGPQCGVGGN